MFKSFLFFFVFIAISTNAQSEFKFATNKKKVTIPFQLINNLMFIPVNLNGEELTFLLDTGVDETILFSLDETNEIELNHVESIKLKGLGKEEAIDAYKSSNNVLSVKSFSDNHHTVYIILDQEINFSSQVGIPVNGILGYNFFKDHLIKIDYKKRKVTIYSDEDKKSRNQLKSYHKDSISLELNKPYVHLNIKKDKVKQKSKLLIDTGNSDALWLFKVKNSEIIYPNEVIDDYLGRGFSGSIYGKRGRLSALEFGGVVINEPIATYPDSVSLKSVNFVENRVGSIGGEITSRYTIFFDYKNNAIYTKPNAKIDEPFEFNMSGIEVQHNGLEWYNETIEEKTNGIKVYTDSGFENRLKVRFYLKPIFKVSNIRPNSPAEKAGLKIGDKITVIDNQNMQRMTIEKINNLLKSEEGKTITLEVVRNNKPIKIKFQLKKIL
ncbi:PDZ domain-containing protein [Flavobacterium solisilvae]|uniref:PDZ domain-containing protein n=1 Tax=Flavobacterium solisilvae TaxID=1852019 RepID=A0ABX1QTI6_9FLAO|nr:PDZ domain-containing protein [Flavobacterium solisilvae]NMH24479.1 PDZ domain-containing protein [Flavobacterium solisilvae]